MPWSISWKTAAAALLASATVLSAAAADQLVFKDGDCVQGKLIRVEANTIVFQSARFGELRVNRQEATVESNLEANTAASHLPEVSRAPVAASGAQPVVTTRGTRRRAGERRPWNGRFSLGTESVQDSTDRKAIVFDGRLAREWSTTRFKGELHYEYRKQDEMTQNDQWKISAQWNRAITSRLFSVYRPVFEWNRHAFVDGAYTPYALVQQELGLGYTFVRRPKRNLSFGVSENDFRGWAINSDSKVNSQVQSAFVEAEFLLPYETKFTQRSVAYHSFKVARSGMEHRLELTRKLTETFSVTVQHQYQRNLPDLRLQNDRRLRLLLGYEF